MPRIEIPITEYDLEELKKIVYENEVVEWTFPADDGEDIEIHLMSEEEYDKRNQ